MEQSTETLTKTCRSCNRTLPLSEFHKNSKSADGLMKVCKDCRGRGRMASRLNGVFPAVKGLENSPLRDFTPRQLIEELQARGFHGKLSYTHEIKV